MSSLDQTTLGQLVEIGRLLVDRAPAVAFTGAGISTESGLPDYRGGQGLWRNRGFEELAQLETFQQEPELFWEFYGHRLEALRHAHPNVAHRALAELEQAGLLAGVITQNVDGLHHAAGSEAAELHGTLREAECLRCKAKVMLGLDPAAAATARWPIALAEQRRAAADDGVPRCDCGYPLKPAVVLFGELLPGAPVQRAYELVQACSLMLCLGSSLQVMPAAQFPGTVLNRGGTVVIINVGETSFDDRPGTIKIEAPLAAALPVIAETALAAQGELSVATGAGSGGALDDSLPGRQGGTVNGIDGRELADEDRET